MTRERTRSFGEELARTILVAIAAAAMAAVPELVHRGYYFHDDMASQYVPMFREVGASVLRGELPLLTDKTWFGGAIAGEYQHGALSPFHALFAAIVVGGGASPPATAVVVVFAYVAFTAAGAYLLARRKIRSPVTSASVGLVAALNGFNVYWCSWLPALTGFSWLPWLWWSIDRRLDARRSAAVSNAAIALATCGLLTAGWHFALLMAVLLVLFAIGSESAGARDFLGAAWKVAPGILVGGLLATPALLCFVEYASASVRTDFDGISWVWSVPLGALKGLVLPLTSSTWTAFEHTQPHPNVVMANGGLALPVLLAVFFSLDEERRRPLRKLVALAGIVLLLTLLPSASRVRWSFRWLPLIHLLLVLACARGLELRASMPARAAGSLLRAWAATPGVLGGVLVVLVLAFEAPSIPVLVGAAVLLATCAMVALAARRRPAALPWCTTLGIALNLLVCPLSWPARDVTPGWDLSTCSLETEDSLQGKRHLGLYEQKDIVDDATRPSGEMPVLGSCLPPGNLGLLFDRPFVNGYSVLFSSGLSEILEIGPHGDLSADSLRQLFGPWSARRALLDRWGIAALTVPKRLLAVGGLEENGWRAVRDLGEATLFARPDSPLAPPLVEPFHPSSTVPSVEAARVELVFSRGRNWVYVRDHADARGYATASVRVSTIEPRRVTAVVAPALAMQGESSALVLLRRPRLPGYRALLDGTPLELGRADGVFVVVELPVDAKGVLTIEYAPLGVRWPGVFAFVMGIVCLMGFGLASRSGKTI